MKRYPFLSFLISLILFLLHPVLHAEDISTLTGTVEYKGRYGERSDVGARVYALKIKLPSEYKDIPLKKVPRGVRSFGDDDLLAIQEYLTEKLFKEMVERLYLPSEQAYRRAIEQFDTKDKKAMEALIRLKRRVPNGEAKVATLDKSEHYTLELTPGNYLILFISANIKYPSVTESNGVIDYRLAKLQAGEITEVSVIFDRE